MVQFCPKCGTKAPDDESAFCNKCGTRLPPVIPEKKDNICPRCGTKIVDEQSAFCNKCGSQLSTIPPVRVQQADARPGAARPVMKKECCPSCGAPLDDEISAYCNVCGANIRGPAPLTPSRETTQPSREKTGPGTLIADRADDGKEIPVQEKSRSPLLKWGIVAVAAVIFFIIIAAFISGMTSGTNQSSTTTPTPAILNQNSGTALPTRITTQPPTPALTPAPAKVQTTAVPTTVVTTNPSTKVTSNASATVTTNVSAKGTSNVSAAVTITPSITNTSQPLSIGQSATDGKAKVTVNSITFKDKLSDPVPSYAIGKKYLIVNITYENLQQNKTADVNLNAMAVTDAGGYAFEKASDVLLENPFIGNTILPQQNRTGNMLFIVPPEATFLKFQYDFGTQIIAKFQLT